MAKTMGKGILIREVIVFTESTNPALRLAVKVEPTKHDEANNGVITMKTVEKTAFPLMKFKVGDQSSMPATKMPAITMLMRVVMVKEEFISWRGFSA
tara:strand:- start:495 stop:785 length:291 start_codon:yes stop_codon:yes gene_type:complete